VSLQRIKEQELTSVGLDISTHADPTSTRRAIYCMAHL